jgi:hypothetical protein
MQQYRSPQDLPDQADQSCAPVCPQYVQHVERCLSMFGQERSHESPQPATATDVLHWSTKQFPASRIGFLVHGEDMKIVRASQSLDQPQYARYDTILSATVNTTRYHQRHFHRCPATTS